MKKIFLAVLLISLCALLLYYQPAMAHTPVTTGNYTVEIGWTDEPPVVGQRNAVVVNLSDSTNADAVIDISAFVVEISYGGQSKTLTLQPLSEDSKNQYIAPILPQVPGKYTIKLSGKVGSTDINTSVDPEEVQPADVLAFPNPNAGKSPQAPGMGLSEWLSIAALVIALAGLVLGFLANQKSSR